ncbi:MAG TPA: metallophosphoesterase [Myxococcota bacterium]|jgi:predicted MPP superfamily phosphohydrolase|nr:metallophosphoesterase [Myxococcota bacterium]
MDRSSQGSEALLGVAETGPRGDGTPPATSRPTLRERVAHHGRGLFKRIVFENLLISLGALLGVMQVLVGHWVLVVFAGLEGPPASLAWTLAGLLVAANVLAIFPVRIAVRRGGLARRAARLYIALGLATLILGGVIALAWAGYLPLAAALEALGVGPATAIVVFRAATLPVVATLTFLVLWGFTAGHRKIDHSEQRIALAGLDERLRGLRVVQISDLHIGNALEGRALAKLVERVNRLAPDLVAVTGDLFDHDPRFVEEGARALAGLRARLGVFAVLGNHDWYTGSEVVAAGLATHAPSVRLLRGEHVRLPTEAPLYVAGVDDPGKDWTLTGLELPQLETLGRAMPADGPTILLVHRPEAFPQAARLGFPLVLAGHTHGGQIALPLPGGHWNPARMLTRFYRGLYEEHRSILYVNRGYGVAGPRIRFNCPREIATLVLS